MSISAIMTDTAVPFRPGAVLEEGELTLLEALARGDRTAAEKLVDLTYHRIYAQLYRLTGDREQAADLTQETYRRAWAGLAGFRGGAQFSTWLHRIAHTTFLNHIRRPRALVPLDEARGVGAHGASGEEEAMVRQDRDRLRRAVLALPETLARTVVARFWSELPVAEIALSEGISEVAVRKRLKKAIDQLGSALVEVSS